VILAVMVALLVAMALVLVRVYLGPGRYNRILAVNLFGTKTVLFVAVVGFLFGRPEFLDIAILYALVNFVATIAVLRLTHYDELVEKHHEDGLVAPDGEEA
jgi:multicomponent Na+:H+ antiporter subunit F